jgi:hypothetical protein
MAQAVARSALRMLTPSLSPTANQVPVLPVLVVLTPALLVVPASGLLTVSVLCSMLRSVLRCSAVLCSVVRPAPAGGIALARAGRALRPLIGQVVDRRALTVKG